MKNCMPTGAHLYAGCIYTAKVSIFIQNQTLVKPRNIKSWLRLRFPASQHIDVKMPPFLLYFRFTVGAKKKYK